VTRPFGRVKPEWNDNIRTDHRQIGSDMFWIPSCKTRGSVTVIMYSDRQITWKFLTNCVIINFKVGINK
jgi:hypothetical protein